MHATSFDEFLLSPPIKRAIADCGFEHPSEVQNQCIPQAILGADVICQAKSGMGKTAVFVISTLEQLKEFEDSSVEARLVALVLCHTRELAFQICKEFERFKRHMSNIKVEVFYGGVPIVNDRQVLQKGTPHIVIGTPGRILKLAQEGHLKLTSIKHFILDECDRMLESIEMRQDVQKIFKLTPHEKQVMMFSATLSQEIRPVCKKFMRKPLEIYVTDNSKLTLHGLQQYYVPLHEREKIRTLFDILDAVEFNQVVIFVRSIDRAKMLCNVMNEGNFPAITIHSRLAQPERIALFKQLKDFKKRILVATDLFGRGIDVSKINVVINFDMPDSADSYLHRVGRAGRFGTKGLAISFVSSEEDATVLNNVQSLFAVNIAKMPETIDSTTYMATTQSSE